MKQLLIKSIVFLFLAVSAIYGIGYYFINYDNANAQAFRSLYRSEKSSIDVVFVGNSHIIKGIDTEIIDAKCNITSLNISVYESNIVEIYNNLKEVLAYQKPKLVFLECWPLIGVRDSYNEPINKDSQIIYSQYNRVYYKNFGAVATEEFFNNNSPLEKNINLIDNRNNWTDFKKWKTQWRFRDAVNSKKYLQEKVKLMWSYDSLHVKKFDLTKHKFSSKNMFVSPIEREYLQKIIKLAETHDFELVLLTVPVYNSYYNKVIDGFEKTQEELKSIAQPHKQVSILDINNKFHGLDYTHILKENDITQNQHLNYKGIIVTSNEVANHINLRYSIEPNIKQVKNTPEKLLYNSHWRKLHSTDSISIEKFQFKKSHKKDTIRISPSNKNSIRLETNLQTQDPNSTIKIAFRKDTNFIYISKDLKLEKQDANLKEKFKIVFSLQREQLISGLYDLVFIEENPISETIVLHPVKQKLILQ